MNKLLTDIEKSYRKTFKDNLWSNDHYGAFVTCPEDVWAFLKRAVYKAYSAGQKEMKSEMRKIIGENIPEVPIEPKETFTQRLAEAKYKNDLRSDLRKKLEEL